MNFKEKLDIDQAVFGQHIMESLMLYGFRKRIWGAWKVLTGEAGIILVRVEPRKMKPNGER